MDMTSARAIFDHLNSTTLGGLRDQALKAAVRYAHMRADWYSMSLEQRKEADRTRTAAHDAFIDSLNILSRNMAKAGEDVQWRADLGSDRKTIGDLACYIACLMGLKSR
jgi:hypothetical protein